ncbi:hypothetical protein FB446DRAFT_752973 [Lentinula raphanica]|nr:hypothetical protein FB446DRAFT_752973 [Lentinula raphanica]
MLVLELLVLTATCLLAVPLILRDIHHSKLWASLSASFLFSSLSRPSYSIATCDGNEPRPSGTDRLTKLTKLKIQNISIRILHMYILRPMYLPC